jgi:hypothetical protein
LNKSKLREASHCIASAIGYSDDKYQTIKPVVARSRFARSVSLLIRERTGKKSLTCYSLTP